MAAPPTLVVALAMLLILAVPAAAAPVPNYSVSPANPVAGEAARYTSTTVADPLQPILSVQWDFNFESDPADDFEVAGGSVVNTFSSPGVRQFRMRVTDLDEVVTRTLTVRVNAPPVGQFGFSPVTPVAGQEVLFQSFSYDIDGRVVTHEWDFDNDWDFNDGDSNEGNVFGSYTFATPGDKSVRLRVRDNHGASRVVRRTVTVAPRQIGCPWRSSLSRPSRRRWASRSPCVPSHTTRMVPWSRSAGIWMAMATSTRT